MALACGITGIRRMATREEAGAVRTPLNETGVGCALGRDHSCVRSACFFENLYSNMSSFHDIGDVYSMAAATAVIVGPGIRGRGSAHPILSPSAHFSWHIAGRSSVLISDPLLTHHNDQCQSNS